MKPNQDVFGQKILAYYNGEKSFEIIERDDGYFDVSSGASVYFSKYKDWLSTTKKAIRFARGKIVDIGCGAGRHSLYLQDKGFDVLGIDSSPLAVKVCKKRGLKKVKLLPIEKIDQFGHNTFDTIIMMGNNFGLFGGYKKARKLLKMMYKITKPNGLIIAETNDPYKTKDPDHLAYLRLNRKRGRMSGQLKLRVRFKTYVGPWFDYLIVSKEELNDIVENTGWMVKKFIESSDGSVYAVVLVKE